MKDGKRGAVARPVAKSRALTTTPWGDVKEADGASGREKPTKAVGTKAKAGAEAVNAVVHETPQPIEASRSIQKQTRKRKPQRAAVPWSPEREAIFLETLAHTCSVKNAVRASGLSSAAIYRRRDASDTFRAAWVQALREAYVRLETELLGRALNGVRKPVWHGGRRVGSVVEYSDRLALALLAQYRETCRGSAQAASPQAEARVVLIEALSRMNRGMGGEG